MKVAELFGMCRRKAVASRDFPLLTPDVDLAGMANGLAIFCWRFGARVAARGHRLVDGVDKGRVLKQSDYREYLDAQKFVLDHFLHLVSPKSVRYFLIVAGYYLESHEYEDGPLGLVRYKDTMLRVAPLYLDMPESTITGGTADRGYSPDDHARNALDYCARLDRNYGYGDGFHLLMRILKPDPDDPYGNFNAEVDK